MFELIRFALEKFINGISWAIDHHRLGKDTEIGVELLDLFERMQNVYVVGVRIVDTLERIAGNGSPSGAEISAATLTPLLQQQFVNIELLFESIERNRRIISTIDGDLFVSLTPLLDRKSGFLVRLLQEGQFSQSSSTFVFFLDHATIVSLSAEGLEDKFRRQVSERVNELRRVEVRDITSLTEAERNRLGVLIRERQIRREIEQIRDISGHFHDKLDAAFNLKSIREHSHSPAG